VLLSRCFSPKTVGLSRVINATRRRQDLAGNLPVPFQAILLRSTGGCGQAMRGESIVVAIRSEHNAWVVDVNTTKCTVQVLTRDLARRRPVVPRVGVLDRFDWVAGWRRSGVGLTKERRESQGECRKADFGEGHDRWRVASCGDTAR
jgi:hypothetical protein